MNGLRLRGVTIRYGAGPRVVSDVDLDLPDGAAVGVVGESGSGKSTLARSVVGMVPLAAGEITRDGRRLRAPGLRRVPDPGVQLVFQDPHGSLNPRMTVAATLTEAARQSGSPERPSLERVGLADGLLRRYPHELSGGQLQRVAIARALAAKPKLLILDEVTSALDVSVQALILNLLRDLRADLGIGYLVIAHDLPVVRYLCDKVAVMHRGECVEQGPCADVLRAPSHPHTRALLDALNEESP
ncbi:ABC transporter ATP-binding protein [Spongiactinospora gelatinilytica]|uniref:ABC transporter ATP-binding protein n=1 Tax=Spongiactinospora gelatinilytica TaxID=2666298 RepID=UPI001F27FE5D|nr:ABC transporter ATP-binding protein [Spongiactinospora gelatinilytica]